MLSGNVKLAMSHVVPDLVQKVVKGQDPLRILGSGEQVRHYTYGADLARGIVTTLEHPAARNEDFNLSTSQSTTVLELAENIWRRISPHKEFRWVSDEPFEFDVQRTRPVGNESEGCAGFRGDDLARRDARCRRALGRRRDRSRPHLGVDPRHVGQATLSRVAGAR